MTDHGPSVASHHPARTSQSTTYLSDDEVKQFIDDLDHNDDGYINYAEVERKLDQAYDELFPESKNADHSIVFPKTKENANATPAHNDESDRRRHEFLRTLMGSSAVERAIPRDEFAHIVRGWKIPSLKQAKKNEDEDSIGYFGKVPGWRRVRAYWAVHGPEIVFLGFVVSMQLAFGIWQLVKYQTTPKYRAAFGWGVVMAKACAGALYPTFFFLLLSMSRYTSTFLRRSYHISRFFNWDLSQAFHIRISCVAILLATLHAIGHLTGSFRSGSDPNNQEEVARVLGQEMVPMAYSDFASTLPGVTGITTLALMYILSLLSIPQVRQWNYEVFQLGHLLMFPIIGLMMAHGTSHLLQWPMFGYFLAAPTLLVLVERSVRVLLSFQPIDAQLKVLDGETVQIVANIPSERIWKYEAGQYIFLQVPTISRFQWHPFTVSFCQGNQMMVHIKTDGNWTGKLRKLGGEKGEAMIKIGINGPFGAPAQRFYDFSHTMIIGSGIGVTPFSGILADLQYKDDLDHGGPERYASKPLTAATDTSFMGANGGEGTTKKLQKQQQPEDSSAEKIEDDVEYSQSPPSPSAVGHKRKPKAHESHKFADDYRRVDFHWIVRDRNYLKWLSDLLNQVSRSQEWHRDHEDVPHLDIRIDTHVTAKRKNIVTHVYRWLLEMHRTDEHPESPFTGLLNPTHFGRPDFDLILDEHYEEIRKFRMSKRRQRLAAKRASEATGEPRSSSSSSSSSSADEDDPDYEEDEELKVGIFYCGASMVGEILADKCRELTTRGRHDGTKIEYHFMIEVFG